MPELWVIATGAVTSGMTSMVNTISSNAIMLLAVAVPFIGAVIGLAKRLLRFGGGRRR